MEAAKPLTLNDYLEKAEIAGESARSFEGESRWVEAIAATLEKITILQRAKKRFSPYKTNDFSLLRELGGAYLFLSKLYHESDSPDSGPLEEARELYRELFHRNALGENDIRTYEFVLYVLERKVPTKAEERVILKERLKLLALAEKQGIRFKINNTENIGVRQLLNKALKREDVLSKPRAFETSSFDYYGRFFTGQLDSDRTVDLSMRLKEAPVGEVLVGRLSPELTLTETGFMPDGISKSARSSYKSIVPGKKEDLVSVVCSSFETNQYERRNFFGFDSYHSAPALYVPANISKTETVIRISGKPNDGMKVRRIYDRNLDVFNNSAQILQDRVITAQHLEIARRYARSIVKA